jgi:hypothetical protein
MCHELCTNHSKKLSWIHSYPQARHHGYRVGSAGKHREENAPSNGITHQQFQHNLVNRIEATSASRKFGQPLVSAMAKTLHPNVSGQERRVQSVSFDGKIANLPFKRMVPWNLGENIPRWRKLCARTCLARNDTFRVCHLRERSQTYLSTGWYREIWEKMDQNVIHVIKISFCASGTCYLAWSGIPLFSWPVTWNYNYVSVDRWILWPGGYQKPYSTRFPNFTLIW